MAEAYKHSAWFAANVLTALGVRGSGFTFYAKTSDHDGPAIGDCSFRDVLRGELWEILRLCAGACYEGPRLSLDQFGFGLRLPYLFGLEGLTENRGPTRNAIAKGTASGLIVGLDDACGNRLRSRTTARTSAEGRKGVDAGRFRVSGDLPDAVFIPPLFTFPRQVRLLAGKVELVTLQLPLQLPVTACLLICAALTEHSAD